MNPLDGTPDFATNLRPRLLALPLFRPPTDHEIDTAYRAYCDGDFAALCDVWRREATAQRATLTPGLQRGYDHAHLAPRSVNAQAFLASLRAVLDAGVRFRAGLSAPVQAVLASDFPWLARRHEHVPPGWTPRFDFPQLFAEWIDVDGEAARVRWQLAVGLNEVQQAHQTADCVRRFGLPELERHAARERQLAINYFSHWAPPVTRALFGEALYLLDALNAAVFALLCLDKPGTMIARSFGNALLHRRQWRDFVDGMKNPQWLLPVKERSLI